MLVTCLLRRTAPVVQQLAVVAAGWLLATAVAAVVGDSTTAVVVVAVVASLVVASLALVLRSLDAAVGVAALGLAAAAVLGASSALVVLAGGLLDEVLDQLTADPHDLLARADLADAGEQVAAPWTLPLAALALVAAVVVLVPSVRTPLRGWRPALAIGLPVLAATVLCYAPLLLLAVVSCVVLAALYLLPQVRPWPRQADLALAIGWAGLAGLLSLYDPAAATVVALLATAVVTAHVVRTGSLAGQLALPPLVAATVGAAGWLVGAPTEWVVVALVVLVAVVTLVVGSDAAMQPVALATCLVAVVVGVDAVDQDGATWLAAYLTLVAAGSAAVGIRDRSRVAAWVSALLEVAAVWVRLASTGVETVEAYTLPLAAVLLAFGLWTLWRRPGAGTTWALGPGLALALVPSLVLAAADPGQPPRAAARPGVRRTRRCRCRRAAAGAPRGRGARRRRARGRRGGAAPRRRPALGAADRRRGLPRGGRRALGAPRRARPSRLGPAAGPHLRGRVPIQREGWGRSRIPGVEPAIRNAWTVWAVGLLVYLVAVFHRSSLAVAGLAAADRLTSPRRSWRRSRCSSWPCTPPCRCR